MVAQPSESGPASAGSAMISIRRTRSEKLLSLKAKAKSASEVEPARDQSDSMVTTGSNRSVFESFMRLTKNGTYDKVQKRETDKRLWFRRV